jgi:hypothetical protein
MSVEVRAWVSAGWTGVVAALLAVGSLSLLDPVAGCTVALALGFLAYSIRSVFRARSLRAMSRWATAMGCFPVGPAALAWPWQNLQLQGSSRVRYAWSGDIEGLPVTFGEVQWSGGAFSGAVVDRDGKGSFVVVGLPQTQPPMAARLPYKFIGDSPRLEQPALRHAFRIMEIPPFTVRDTELFTVEARDEALDPGSAYRAIRRALLVVRLLDVGPDRPQVAA